MEKIRSNQAAIHVLNSVKNTVFPCSVVKTKTNSDFAVKFVEENSHPFSAYLMNLKKAL